MTTASLVLSAGVWGGFSGLVLAAMWLDARQYRIPNWISLALTALFLALALLIVPLPLASHGLAAFGIFALAAALYFRGLFGGGDVKFLAAVSLWAGPPKLAALLLLMGLIGGLVGLCTLAARRLAVSAPGLAESLPLGPLRRWSAEGRVPYGLAIGMAALIVIPELLAR